MNKNHQPYLECKACGYFYAETEENGVIKPIRGNERFITIKFNKVDIYLGGYTEPDAYACPKCKTIRLS